MFAGYAVSVVLLVVALVDMLRTPAALMRTLPKPLWLLVVLPPYFGPVAWFLAGRPKRGTSGPVPGRQVAPDDDEDFLRELRRRSRDPRDD